eukprot:TRINITY_DN6999_c0_g2_i1.p1 TRINITY_DN6999_c0_g2~~TRINITY_DN6999_c0_g2_i1.p1  ORF type:complete len:271 (-),score=29.98 TRINITY_DN6999_c0_g2_i1:5-769(-)
MLQGHSGSSLLGGKVCVCVCVFIACAYLRTVSCHRLQLYGNGTAVQADNKCGYESFAIGFDWGSTGSMLASIPRTWQLRRVGQQARFPELTDDYGVYLHLLGNHNNYILVEESDKRSCLSLSLEKSAEGVDSSQKVSNDDLVFQRNDDGSNVIHCLLFHKECDGTTCKVYTKLPRKPESEQDSTEQEVTKLYMNAVGQIDDQTLELSGFEQEEFDDIFFSDPKSWHLRVPSSGTSDMELVDCSDEGSSCVCEKH